VEVEMNTIAK